MLEKMVNSGKNELGKTMRKGIFQTNFLKIINFKEVLIYF